MDLVIDPRDPWKFEERRLQHLFEIERRDTTRQHQPTLLVVDFDGMGMAPKMGVTIQATASLPHYLATQSFFGEAFFLESV